MAAACGRRFSWGSIPHRHLLADNSVLRRETLFRYHAANLRSVGSALDQIDRVGKDALRRDDPSATVTFTRLYSLLLAATAECELLKITHEKAVSRADRARIMAQGSQTSRWLEAIDVGHRRQFNVPPPTDLGPALLVTQRARRETLRDAIENDLRPVIELRNVLAHGQWHYAFTSDADRLNQESMRALRVENLSSLHHKRRIVRALGHCVHDLLVSAPTFERDFDSHFKEVERQRTKLSQDDFDGYVEFLRRRHEKRKKYLAG
jgi:hypothetical protein